MSNSGKSRSEQRQRAAKVAPRRHVDPPSQAAGGTYDSQEFPVLLRMPDISQPAGSVEQPPVKLESPVKPEPPVQQELPAKHALRERSAVRTEPRENSPPAEPAEKRHAAPATSSPPVRSSLPERRTGAANARFWSTVPPQLAAGGMLLAVTALCFILLSDSGPQATDPVPANEWTFDSEETQSAAPVPLAPNSQFASSPEPTTEPSQTTSLKAPAVAPQPAPPQFTVEPPPAPPQFTSGAGTPRTPTSEPVSGSTTVSGWPTGELAASPVDDDDVTPVQGWPTLDDATPDAGAVESAERSAPPMLRTSQRTSPTLPALGDSTTPRLDGTIEIPPPTKIYRQ